MAAEELILRMVVENGRVAAADVEGVNTALGTTETRARRANEQVGRFAGGLHGVRGAIKSVIGMAGFAGMAFGIADVVKKTTAMQTAMGLLRNAAKQAGLAVGPATERMHEFADSLATRGGFAPSETVAGLTNLLRVTKNVGAAQKDMTLATDVARGMHLSMTRAVRALMMVEEGRTTGLSRMGIFLPKITTAMTKLHANVKNATAAQTAAATAADAHASRLQALTALTQKFGGATNAYSKSAEGSLSNLRNTVDILAVNLGKFLLPILSAVAKWLIGAVGWIRKNADLVKELAAVVLGAVVAYKAFMIIEKVVSGVQLLVTLYRALRAGTLAETVAQMDLNVAMLANPIGIVVLAIAALVAAFIVAYNKVKWFRDMVGAVWDWLKGAVTDTIHFISHHWVLLVSILGLPFVGLAVFIATHFKDVKSIIVDILNWILTQVNRVIGVLNTLHIHTPFGDIGVPHINPIGLIGQQAAPKQYGGHAYSNATYRGSGGMGKGGRALGGPVNYGGMYDVGEHGKETVYLPGGSYVAPHGNPDEMAAAIAGALNGAAVEMDGRRVGQLVVRQGKLQAARQ